MTERDRYCMQFVKLLKLHEPWKVSATELAALLNISCRTASGVFYDAVGRGLAVCNSRGARKVYHLKK